MVPYVLWRADMINDGHICPCIIYPPSPAVTGKNRKHRKHREKHPRRKEFALLKDQVGLLAELEAVVGTGGGIKRRGGAAGGLNPGGRNFPLIHSSGILLMCLTP